MASRVLEVQIVGDAAQLERALGRATGAAQGFGDRMQTVGSRMQSVGRTMTRDLTLPIVGIGAASAYMGLKFEESMQLLRGESGASQAEVNKMSSAVLDMAGTLKGGGASAEDLAGGLLHIEDAGLRGGSALTVLSAAAQGAMTMNANLVDTANALVGVMKSLKAPASDAKNIMAEISAIVGQGNMHLGDFTGSLGSMVIGLGKELGATLPQIGAFYDVLTNQGKSASSVGTSLVRMLTQIQAPTKAGAAALADMGIKAGELGQVISTGGLPAVLQLLHDKMIDMGKAGKLSQFKTDILDAFGKSRGGALVLDAVANLDTYKEKLKNISESTSSYTGNIEAAWHLNSTQVKASINSAKASMTELGIAMAPVVADVAKYIKEGLAWFDKLSKGTKDKILIALGAIALVGPAFTIMGKAIAAAGVLMDTNPIILLAGALTILVGALAAAEFAPKQFEAALQTMGVSIGTSKEIVKGLGDAFVALKDVVLIAIAPIRLIVTTMVDTIKSSFQLVDALIHGRWSQAWQDAKSLALAPINAFKSTFGGLIGDFTHIADTIGSGIDSHLVKPLEKLPGEAWAWFMKLVGKIQQLGVEAWHEGEKVGAAIIEGFISGIGSLAGKAFGALSSFAHSAWHFLSSPWSVFSPSRKTRKLGQDVVQGFIDGIHSKQSDAVNSLRSLSLSMLAAGSLNPAQFKAAWGKLTAAAVQSITGGTPAVAAAMRNLENAALTAFDTATVAGTNRIKARTDAQVAAIKSRLNADLATISAAYNSQVAAINAPVNALQAKMQAQQQAHDLAAAQANVQTAQQQLAADQASGADAQTLKNDQQAIDDANYQLQQVQEQIQLTQEQAEAQKKLAAAKKEQAKADKLARDEAAKDTKNVKDQGKAEETRWKETRAAERKGLTAYLADVKAGLDVVASEWKTHHDKLMAQFNGKFKKDFGNAGTALASAFNDSVKAGMKELQSFLEKLGIAIDSYLKPGGGIPGHAEGGPTKAGLAVLHDGEYVLQRTAANAIGRHNLDRLNQLPHFDSGGSFNLSGLPAPSGPNNPNTGLPDMPEYRAAAMYLNDYGVDRNVTSVGTALAGLIGPRAQAQAAVRHTYVDGEELMTGTWRAADLDPKWVALIQAQYPGIVFEEGSPGQQISAGQAVSRLKGGLAELGGLIGSSLGLTGKTSPVERLTSHAVHFASGYTTDAIAALNKDPGNQKNNPSFVPAFKTGGVMPYDGLAYLHKNETIIPADTGAGSGGGGGTLHLHVENLHVTGDLSNPTQRRQTARLLMDDILSEARRRSQRVNTLGLH